MMDEGSIVKIKERKKKSKNTSKTQHKYYKCYNPKPDMFSQLNIIRESRKSFKDGSVDTQRETRNLAFSKRSLLTISSSNIFWFLQNPHNG